MSALWQHISGSAVVYNRQILVIGGLYEDKDGELKPHSDIEVYNKYFGYWTPWQTKLNKGLDDIHVFAIDRK